MKIGMYSDEEILEHLTEGEGRGFLGRSMYDAIMGEIEQLKSQLQQKENIIKEVREYINEYAWQEDIIGGEYTTTGKPVTDRYMRLEWDNCNELLEILDKVD